MLKYSQMYEYNFLNVCVFCITVLNLVLAFNWKGFNNLIDVLDLAFM